jgi:hypothetical protein
MGTAAEDSANGLPWGSTRPDVAPAPPAPWRRLRARIEDRADVVISLTSFDDEEFGKGWFARAVKATDHQYSGGMTSRTVSSVWADGPFLALDKLAKNLGVSVEATDALAPTSADEWAA